MKKVTIILACLLFTLAATAQENKLIRGFDGGMMLHTGFLKGTLDPIGYDAKGAPMGIGGAITGAAGLAYIGLGVQPPTPEWGAMLSAGRNYIRNYPHLLFFPGLCIAITVLAINLFGDGLRDALDPKLKK